MAYQEYEFIIANHTFYYYQPFTVHTIHTYDNTAVRCVTYDQSKNVYATFPKYA